MTNIEQKALELVNEVCREWEVSLATEDCMDGSACFEAFCRAIERHEAFRQEVSDAVESVIKSTYITAPSRHKLERFIITKPDPLVEAMVECGFGDSSNAADDIRAALAKRGGRIVFDD